jgi:EAL domain-containing protein (putative c-di-GMP-specific phosphodiesterase class I)
VFRLGGDEFSILMEQLDSLDTLRERVSEMIALLSQPMEVGTHELQTSASIGITLIGIDACDNSGLLRNADLAMYRAKRAGRNTYAFFNHSMNTEARRTLTLEHDLRHALEQGELHLHYQPQVELSSGQIIGMEALLRWQHPIDGNVPPDEFIPIAEETGMILPIGRWVLEQACTTAARIRRLYGRPFRMAVNLSARQFEDPDLILQIDQILADTGLPGEYLELEITESLLVNNFVHINDILRQLRRRGITIAVDDFGTGYSSLNYLKKLEVNQLKIDRSFVQDIPGDRDDVAITSTIILMARQLGLDVIAEGIETAQQQHFLLQQGCRTGQGFYFSRPVPFSQLQQHWT